MVRRWLPPALVRFARKARAPQTFGSYEAALALCGEGYDSAYLADVVVAKSRVFRDLLSSGEASIELGSLRTLVALSLAAYGSRPVRVLDFGGAAGAHYFIARTAAHSSLQLDWRVVETRAMVNAAAALATSELSFHESIDEALAGWTSEPDVLVASGVLQYVPDPPHVLEQLLNARPARILITRTALSSDTIKRVIVQSSSAASNGPGPLPRGFRDTKVRYPATFVPKSEFEQAFRRSYSIDLRLAEERDVFIGRGFTVDMAGYLLRRADRC
jgi:putative methyltransferase (TIGR04325 family)